MLSACGKNDGVWKQQLLMKAALHSLLLPAVPNGTQPQSQIAAEKSREVEMLLPAMTQPRLDTETQQRKANPAVIHIQLGANPHRKRRGVQRGMNRQIKKNR
jgi:hypothetical protein